VNSRLAIDQRLLGLTGVTSVGNFSVAKMANRPLTSLGTATLYIEMLQAESVAFGKRVVPVQVGIWQERDGLRVVNPEAGLSAFRMRVGTYSAQDVAPAFAMDEICEIVHTGAPRIVKLDIKGA
jgi:hypothetical protein